MRHRRPRLTETLSAPSSFRCSNNFRAAAPNVHHDYRSKAAIRRTMRSDCNRARRREFLCSGCRTKPTRSYPEPTRYLEAVDTRSHSAKLAANARRPHGNHGGGPRSTFAPTGPHPKPTPHQNALARFGSTPNFGYGQRGPRPGSSSDYALGRRRLNRCAGLATPPPPSPRPIQLVPEPSLAC